MCDGAESEREHERVFVIASGSVVDGVRDESTYESIERVSESTCDSTSRGCVVPCEGCDRHGMIAVAAV